MYIRQLPIAVHTKFIEANKGVLNTLLSIVLRQYLNPEGESFEERFHLKNKHNLIRIRFLDTSISPFTGYGEIGIAENDINKLQIKPRRVFIVENDITALAFPAMQQSILIFGKGYNLSTLKHIEWLKEAEVFYWSDIDVQGFEMLSQIRSYFPQTKSLLMDESTLSTYLSDTGSGTKSKNSIPPLLSKDEATLYAYVQENNLRLE